MIIHKALKEISKRTLKHERILDLVDLVREKQKRVMSITLANLITLDVHKENAMKNLLVKGAKLINEFDWIAAFNSLLFHKE